MRPWGGAPPSATRQCHPQAGPSSLSLASPDKVRRLGLLRRLLRRRGYMADYWNHNKPALVSALRSIKHQATSMASTIGASATAASEPLGTPQLAMYPTYSFQTPERSFSVTVRGWLYYEGDLSKRRNKLLVATTERFVGGQNSGQEFKQQLIDIDQNSHDSDASLGGATSQVLRRRMEPFFRKSVALEPVDVDVYGARGEYERFAINTDAGGRFEHTFTLAWRPHHITADARGAASSLVPQFVAPSGVSVISDVDDTVRLTGILNGKRDTLRNVLVASYEKVKLKGVAEWYQQMAARGASFHYVSNSPWQMFDVVEGFLQSQSFPKGSMHLKRYSGLIDGIFEPVVHRKVKSLYQILQDFPHRKFILVGDGGELDLETYVQLARQFPTQILAIYIRDLIMPESESLEVEVPPLSEDLIDLEPYVAPKNTKPGRPGARRFNSANLIKTIKAPLSPRKGHQSSASVSGAPSGASSGAATPFKLGSRTPTGSRSRSVERSQGAAEAQSSHAQGQAQGKGHLHPPQPPSRHQLSAEFHQPTHGGVAGAVFGASSRPGAVGEMAHMAREHLRNKAPPPGFVSSSQDYSEYDRIDKERKRIDNWKARLIEAKRALPAEVELRMWRDPSEVMSGALRLIRDDPSLL